MMLQIAVILCLAVIVWATLDPGARPEDVPELDPDHPEQREPIW